MSQHLTLLDMSGIAEYVRYTLMNNCPTISVRYRLEEYLNYLVEELRWALNDPEASSFEPAARYLVLMGVNPQLAYEISMDMKDAFIDLIGANFPRMTLLELSRRTFVIINYNTLAVRD